MRKRQNALIVEQLGWLVSFLYTAFRPRRNLSGHQDQAVTVVPQIAVAAVEVYIDDINGLK